MCVCVCVCVCVCARAQKNWNWVEKCVGGRKVESTVGLNSARRCTISNPNATFLVLFFNYIHPTNAQYILKILLIHIVHFLDKYNTILQNFRYIHQECSIPFCYDTCTLSPSMFNFFLLELL